MPVGWVSRENKNSQYHVPGKPFLTRHLGHYMNGSTRATGGVGIDQPEDGPDYTFVNDESMKPYLYGNWYRSFAAAVEDQEDGELKLIGLGVGLGTSPTIENGEGNSSEESHCRGTALRVRAMEGLWLLSSFGLDPNLQVSQAILRRNLCLHVLVLPGQAHHLLWTEQDPG